MLPPALSPRLPNSGPSPRSQGRIFALHVSLMPFAFSASGAAAPPRNWVALALLIALSCLWIATLGGNVLLSPDEGRYATISLDMLRSGDWITPRLNGDQLADVGLRIYACRGVGGCTRSRRGRRAGNSIFYVHKKII